MVIVGLTLGFETVEVNPDGLLTQLYVFPATAVAPIDALLPMQIEVLLPVFAEGKGFVVMITLSLAEQPDEVCVK